MKNKFIIGLALIAILTSSVRVLAQAFTPQQIQQAIQAISQFGSQYNSDESQIQNLQGQIANLQSDAATVSQQESYLQAVVSGYEIINSIQSNQSNSS